MTKMDLVENILGPQGKLLYWSKSKYIEINPNNRVFFNGNLYGPTGEKLWYGDIDLTKDAESLQRLADELGEIFVTRESPFRWGTTTVEELREEAEVPEYPSVVVFQRKVA